MSGSSNSDSVTPTIAARTAQILEEQSEAGHRMIDRMFAFLLVVEWLASILMALLVSPSAWVGESQSLHPHVWAAVFLGGLTISLPIALTLARPGRSSTRQCVAVGQMLLVALIIHLSGGRLENHFHIFVSLALLAFYQDWRVMVTASIVVALDHYLRGIYWPRSVFGVGVVAPWRWFEHSLWVVFEDIILIYGLGQSLALMREASRRRAEVEATRDRVEVAVLSRTAELQEAQAGLEYRVLSRTLELQEANSSLHDEVAERRKVEIDLRASEGQFRTLAEALPQIVWGTNAEGLTDYFNARWYDYSGLTPEQSLVNGWFEILHPDDRARTAEVWDRAVATGTPYQIEYRFRRGQDGAYRWHLALGLPLLKPDGSVLRWFGTCTDIDDQKKAAESLRQSHDELEARVQERTAALERANYDLIIEVVERTKAEDEAHRSLELAELATRSKSEFLANMSHEIRTPMNAIIGMTELTLDMDLSTDQRDNLEVVRMAADSLLELIDDILDFSKIEAGKLELDPIRFRPREVVEAAVKTLSLRAAEKGLSLSSTIAQDVPQALIGDPLRLRQVLLNLLGNAIKFTAKGRVEVRVGLEVESPDGFVLTFSVSDEGIGIPASRLAMIFDSFSQADGSTTRRFGGTGLGLSISTRLVELMGGRIWVESQVDQGSTFHFTSQFGKAPTELTGPEAAEELSVRRPNSSATRRLRVLLVDDNELNRRVGTMLLERIGHEVLLAVDGPNAVSRYELDGPFDLVLMDIQMPVMDGFEATALIRAIQSRQGRRCPIIALTAFAMKGDRERCLAEGMDEHLTKPVRGEEIVRLIDRLIAVDEEPTREPGPRWSLDPEEVRAAFPIDPAEMAEIVGLFRVQCREKLASISEAIVYDDPNELARSVHGMMGSLGMFATEATIDLAISLEEAGRSKNLDEAGQVFLKLSVAIAAMQPTLDVLADVSKDVEAKHLVADQTSTV